MASYVSLDSATAGSWTKLNSTTVPEGIVAGNTIYPGIWFGPQENSSGYDYQASWNSVTAWTNLSIQIRSNCRQEPGSPQWAAAPPDDLPVHALRSRIG